MKSSPATARARSPDRQPCAAAEPRTLPARRAEGSRAVDVAELERMAAAHRKLSDDWRRKVREFNCLHAVACLLGQAGVTLEELCHWTVTAIPTGWQYPDVTCARIVLAGEEFESRNFRETAWRQAAEIRVHGEPCGAVEVGYLRHMPQRHEGPFLGEERRLLNAIAKLLGHACELEHAEKAARQRDARLQELQSVALDVGRFLAALARHAESLPSATHHDGQSPGGVDTMRSVAARASSLTARLLELVASINLPSEAAT